VCRLNTFERVQARTHGARGSVRQSARFSVDGTFLRRLTLCAPHTRSGAAAFKGGSISSTQRGLVSMAPEIQRDFYNSLYAAGAAAGAIPVNIRCLAGSRCIGVLWCPHWSAGTHMLDLGSGDGSLLIRCAPRFARLTELIRRCPSSGLQRKTQASRGLDNVSSPLRMSITAFRLAPRRWMLRLCRGTRVYFPIPSHSLRVARVLKPGGQLVIEF